MPDYCVLRVGKLKKNRSVTLAGEHCLRTRPTPNADSEADIPKVIIGSGDFLNDLTKRYDEAGIVKRRSNGVLALEVIMSASANFFRPDDPLQYGYYDQGLVVKFNEYAIAWVEEEFEEKNVVAVVCHVDEGTPHIHALVAPLDATATPAGKIKTRQNAKRWTGGSGKMRGLQTRFAIKMEPLGLVRGIAGSRASHQRVKKHYGALYIDASPIPAPRVSLPPAAIRKTSREQWASKESERLEEEQKETVERLIVQAQLGVHAQRRADDMAATASYAQRQHQAMTDRLRDIQLDRVAADLGLSRSNKDRHKWNGPGFIISVTGKKFYDHHNNRGGGGAIDLVMHCQNADYLQSVAWLADRYGDSAAARSVAVSAEDYVARAKSSRKPYRPPIASAEAGDWDKVRAYLTKVRALDDGVVNYLHDRNMVYAQQRNGHINCVFAAVRANCAELVGIGNKRYKGLAPGSSPSSGGFRLVRNKEKSEIVDKPLVLVESAIEAVSFFEICDYDCEIISTCGCKPDSDFIHEAILKKRIVLVGYNNDVPGEDAYLKLLDNYKGDGALIQKQFPPQQYDDWNDCLRVMKNGQIAADECGEATEETKLSYSSRDDADSLFSPRR